MCSAALIWSCLIGSCCFYDSKVAELRATATATDDGEHSGHTFEMVEVTRSCFFGLFEESSLLGDMICN